MNALIEKWADALESGKYEQGKNYLREGNRFCCLGVLCDLVNPDGWNGNVYKISDEIEEEDLPNEIAKLADLSLEKERYLIKLNDSGVSFKDIAKYIRKEL